MSIGGETQAASAQRMYDARAATYDRPWHRSYMRQFTSLFDIRQAARVLDPCRGTGHNSFAAADRVRSTGYVVGYV